MKKKQKRRRRDQPSAKLKVMRRREPLRRRKKKREKAKRAAITYAVPHTWRAISTNTLKVVGKEDVKEAVHVPDIHVPETELFIANDCGAQLFISKYMYWKEELSPLALFSSHATLLLAIQVTHHPKWGEWDNHDYSISNSYIVSPI